MLETFSTSIKMFKFFNHLYKLEVWYIELLDFLYVEPSSHYGDNAIFLHLFQSDYFP